MKHTYKLLVVVAAALLAGCSAQEDNVRSELKALTKNLVPKIEKLPAPIDYENFNYDATALADPFSPGKINLRSRPGGGVQPDLQRDKQPLEAFPLEQLRMVGAVKLGNVMYAVINADGYLYRVRAGQFVGQNYGRVQQVTETSTALREMFQEPNGDWAERDASLSIQDSTEVKK